MKGQGLRISWMFVLCVIVLPGVAAAQCQAEGGVEFVCGPVSPEDLVAVPDTPWVVVAGMEDDGYLYITDTRDHQSTVLFPVSSYRARLDPTFTGCGGPVTGGFRPHGLNLRVGEEGRHTLYVVRHGAHESIEIFELDAGGSTPDLTWTGCVLAPDGVAFNSVAAVPGGGFVATQFSRPVGRLWEWRPGRGWSEVPGSETNGPNGLVASSDGRWLYVGGWGTQSLIRLSRGQNPVQRVAVAVGFHIDNVRWAPDGSLLAAGHRGETPEAIFQCLGERACEGVTSRVARIDPDALTAEELVRYPSNDLFILGTVGLQVDDEIWVGGIAGSDRIARFPLE